MRRTIPLAAMAILMTGCSIKRHVVTDSFRASSVQETYTRRDSLFDVARWVKVSDRAIEIQYLSAPDSTGAQYITAKAIISESSVEESTSSSKSVTEQKKDTDSTQVTVEHKESKTKTRSQIPEIIGGIFFTVLLGLLVYFTPRK